MSNLRSFFFILIVFFYIFNFTLSFLGVSSVALLIPASVLLLLVDPVLRSFVGYAFFSCRFAVLALLLAGTIGFTLSIAWGNSETIFLEIFIKFVIIFFLALVIIFYSGGGRAGASSAICGFNSCFELIYWATVLQAVFVIMSFVDTSFRGLLSDVLVNRGNIEVDSILRFRGVHDSGGFSLSAILALGAVYGVYSVFSRTNSATIWRFFSISIIALSIMLVARTGVVVFLLGVGLLAIRWPLKSFIVSLVFLAFCASAILLFQYFFPERFEFFSTYIFEYAFEIFINYSEGRGLTSASTDDLKSMLFLPELLNIIFGSGSFDDQSGGVARSDSGYLKTLLASGIVGFILVYTSYWWMFLKVWTNVRQSADAGYFVLVLLCLILVLEVKAPVFYQNDVSRLFILVFSSALLQRFFSTHAVVHSSARLA